MNDIYESVGKTIRFYREKIGITQAKLADITDLSNNFIGQIERGTKKASLETIRKIANALQIPVFKLFDEISETKLSITQEKKILKYQISEAIKNAFKDNDIVYNIVQKVIKGINKY